MAGVSRRHGTRSCYVWGPEPGRGKGCRCFPCRVANARAMQQIAEGRRLPWRSAYIPTKKAWAVMDRETREIVLRTTDRGEAHKKRDELNRRDARRDPVWLSGVEEAALRAHLKRLGQMGLSKKAIARAARVSPKTITAVLLGYDPAPDRDRGQGHRPKHHRGGPKRIRREIGGRILAVSASDVGSCDLVDAGPTWELLETLFRAGYPKAHVAQMLGSHTPAIQIKRTRVAGRTARKVRDLYERLWKLDPRVRLVSEGARPFPRHIRDRHGAWRKRADGELVRLEDARLRKLQSDREAKRRNRGQLVGAEE